MTGDKIRFRFAKTGDLRLLSHHDLMRCLERMLRRAAVPFKSTAGFHPTPRLVFALSLPLGVVGRDEVMELELTTPCDAADLLARLNAQAPAGLAFTRVTVVPMKATAVPRRVIYNLPLPPDRVAETAARCAELLRAEKVWVERTRPNPKRLNIRPYLRGLEVNLTPHPPSLGGKGEPEAPPRFGEGLGRGSVLTLDLWVTGTGTARADELLKLVGLGDVLDAGAVLFRDLMEIRDEVTNPDPGDGPPDGPAESLPLAFNPSAAPAPDDDPNPSAAAHWGASPSGPVVE